MTRKPRTKWPTLTVEELREIRSKLRLLAEWENMVFGGFWEIKWPL
jgi:hypothetical protein